MSGKGCVWLAGLLALLVAVAACSQNKQTSELRAEDLAQRGAEDIGPIAGASVANLNESELRQLSAAGLDGNAQAAFKVHMHYQMAMLDKENGKFWARIAAENGSVDGMVEYADYLLEVLDEYSCRRARFWAKRALGVATSDDERASARSFHLSVDERCKTAP